MVDSSDKYHDCHHVGKVSRYEVEAAKDASSLPSPREVVSGQSRDGPGSSLSSRSVELQTSTSTPDTPNTKPAVLLYYISYV